ncbi:IS200/IS605 family element transposase accessory protein TnpB [Glycomyces albus]
MGGHLGSLAAKDLKRRCALGPAQDSTHWAERKRELTAASSARWAGAITRANNRQWALARRNQATRIASLEGAIETLRLRLEKPIGSAGTKRTPGGYETRLEWHQKARRLENLRARLSRSISERDSGRIRVVRGGRDLARKRHNLSTAGMTEAQWRLHWNARRLFLFADGEAGRPFGNDTIRVTDRGEVEINLPAPLRHLANGPRGRYRLTGRLGFAHRGTEWSARVTAGRAVGYRIGFDPDREAWYVTAYWKRPESEPLSLDRALTRAASESMRTTTTWPHGASIPMATRSGNRSGSDSNSPAAQNTATRSCAMLSKLLRWANRVGAGAIAIENLDFAGEKTRSYTAAGRRSGASYPDSPPLGSRPAWCRWPQKGIAIVAVDAAYTSKWGAQHWQKPMTTPKRKTTRHDAASIVIGRRAQGHKARRRMPPPRSDRSDRRGHRSTQAGPSEPRREESRHRPRGSPS